jgi:hypothetical protein
MENSTFNKDTSVFKSMGAIYNKKLTLDEFMMNPLVLAESA